jgi:hypothetical protein
MTKDMSDVVAQVTEVMALWNDGMLGRGEVAPRLADLLTATNIDEVWAATPDEWRADLLKYLEGLAGDGELISISGGIYMYEVEPDPVRRAEMKAEVEREEAARNAYIEQVIVPALRNWLRGRESLR